MSIVYVSCLYDLQKREPQRKARTPEDYMNLGKWFMEQPIHKVIFCDSHFVEPLRNATDPAKTLVIDWPLENVLKTPGYMDRMMDHIQQAQARNPVRNANPDKDTPWYTLLGWSKAYLLDRVARLKPFGPSFSHVAWLDFGIKHVVIPEPDWHVTVEKNKHDSMIQCLCINPAHVSEFSNLKEYYSVRRYKVGGGFWLMKNYQAANLFNHFRREMYHALYTLRIAPLEDEILGVIVGKEPDLFEQHYGDYQDILNVDYPRHSFNLVWRGVITSNNMNVLARSYHMLSALLRNPNLETDKRRECTEMINRIPPNRRAFY